MANGLHKASSTAVTFGVSLDSLLGNVTAIQTATRDTGNSIGRALKTIYSRVTTMDDSIGILKSIGIEVLNLDGTARKVEDVFGELASKWQGLTNIQRQSIAVQIAGRDHLSKFLALMNNWNISVEASKAALNSQGSALKENEAYQESLQARLNRLTVAWEQLSLSIGNAVLTDSFVATIESLKDIANASSSVIDTVGFLPIVFGGIFTAISMLNPKFREAITSTNMLSGSFKGLAVSADMAKMAIRGLLASTIVGAVFAVIGVGVERLISSFTDAKKQADELKKQNNEAVKSYSAHNQEIDKLASRYEYLAEKQNDGKLDTSEQKEYVEIQNQLNKLMPILTEKIDEKGNAHLRSAEAVKSEIEYVKQLKDNYDKLTLEKFEENVSDIYDRISKKRSSIENLSSPTRQYVDISGDGSVKSQESSEEALLREREMIQNQNELKLILREVTDAAKAKLDAYLDVNGVTEKLTEADRKYLYSQIESKKATFEQAKSADDFKKIVVDTANQVSILGETIAKVKSLGGITSSLSIEDIQSLTKDQINALSSFSSHMGGSIESWSRYISILESAKIPSSIISQIINNIKNELNGLSNSLEDTRVPWDQFNDSMDKAFESIDVLTSAEQELQEEGKLSAQTVWELSQKYEGFSKVINGTKEDILNFLTAKQTESAGFVDTEIQKTNALIQESNTRIQQMMAEGSQLLKLQALQSSVYSSLNNIFKRSGQLTDDQVRGMMRTGNIDDSEQEKVIAELDKVKSLQKELEKYNTAKQVVRDYAASGGKSGWKDKDKSGSKDKKGDQPSYTDPTDSIIAQINAESDLIAKKKESIKAQADYYSKTKDYNKEIEATNQLLSEQSNHLNALTSANKSISAEAQKIRDANKKYNTWKWFDGSNEATPEYVNFINDLEKKGLKSEKENVESLFSKLQKLKKAYTENQTEAQGVHTEIIDLGISLKQLKFEESQREVEKFDDSISKLEHTLSLSESMMSMYEEGTEGYNNELKRQVELNQQIQAQLASKQSYLKSMIATVAEGSDEWKEYNQQLQEVETSQQEVKKSLYDTQKDFADKIIDAYKEVYEKQKDLELERIDDLIDAEEKRHDKAIENIEKEYDEFEEAVNKQIALIDKQAATEDYNKNLSKAQKEAQDIQNKINVLSLDDSIEAKVQREELQKQLAEKLTEIEEMQINRERELRKDNLQDQLDEYKKDVDAKKKAENSKYESAKDSLEKQKKETEKFWNNEISNLNANLSLMDSQIARFEELSKSKFKNVGDSITSNLIQKAKDATSQWREMIDVVNSGSIGTGTNPSTGNSSNPSNGNSGGKQVKGSLTKSYNGSPSAMKGFFWIKDGSAIAWGKALEEFTGKSIGSKFQAQTINGEKFYNVREVLDELLGKDKWDIQGDKINKYHKGGFVGDKHPLFANLKPNEIPAILENQEFVLSKDMLTKIGSNLQIPKMSQFTPLLNNGNKTLNFNPIFNVNIEGGTNIEQQAKKLTDLVTDNLIQRMKPFGFV